MGRQVEDVKWGMLTKGRTPADVFPRLLHLLASSDKGDFSKGFDLLWQYAFPEREIPHVTVALIPFLIQLLDLPGFENQMMIMTFLAQVAQSAADENCYSLQKPQSRGRRARFSNYAAYIRYKNQRAVARLALEHVAKGFSSFLPYLESEQSAQVEAALMALAWCGAQAAEPIKGFINDNERQIHLLPLAYLALGRIPGDHAPVFWQGLQHPSQVVQLAAGLGSILSSQGEIFDYILGRLGRFIFGANVYEILTQNLMIHCGALGTPDIYLSHLSPQQLNILNVRKQGFALHWALEKLISKDNALYQPAVNHLADLILYHYLSLPPCPESFQQRLLSQAHRAILSDLVEKPIVWTVLEQRAPAFERGDWWQVESLRQFLGQAPSAKFMPISPTTHAAVADLCVELGREYWHQGTFVFFSGEAPIVHSLSALDVGQNDDRVSENANEVATLLYHRVVKSIDWDLSHYSFYSFISPEEVIEFLCDVPYEYVPPPHNASQDDQLGFAED